MASKKFKVDKKALAAVAQSSLAPTPKLLPEQPVRKESSGIVIKEKESGLKRKSVESAPPSSPKKAKQVPSKEPRAVQPTLKEAAPMVGASSVRSRAFPSGPIDPGSVNPLTFAGGSSTSGPSRPESAAEPTNWPNPQGPDGECCLSFKSFKGWFPEDHGFKGYPTECFKSFSLPQDLKHFEKRSLASVCDEYVAAQGVVNSLGIRVVKMAKNLSTDAQDLKKKHDALADRDAVREQNCKELGIVLGKERELSEGHKARVKSLEDELDVLRESSKILEKEKEDVQAQEKIAVNRAEAAEARAVALGQELANLRTNPSAEVRKLVIDQYQASEEFGATLAEAAFPEWETGWSSCERFLAEEGVKVPEGFSSKAYWAKHPEGYSDEEGAGAGT